MEDLVTQHSRFDPQHRQRQLGDLTEVLDRACRFYRTIGAVTQGGRP
jgi:hypothetical protein